ncbi:hypothetical protein Hanom_Chr01g00023231 [Helianthus anomalus]
MVFFPLNPFYSPIYNPHQPHFAIRHIVQSVIVLLQEPQLTKVDSEDLWFMIQDPLKHNKSIILVNFINKT